MTNQPLALNPKYVKMSPGEYVVHAFGGVKKTAKALGLSKGTVSKWHNPRYQTGKQGYIPVTNLKKILCLAQELNLDINANDLIMGRTIRMKYDYK